jgi:hypothetical protein
MEIYNVTQSGETNFLSAPTLKDALIGDRVLIIVADDLKTIYLWKGKESSVRKKFIGARLAQAVRGDRGLMYRVEPVDQEEEPPALLNILGNKPAESPSSAAKSMDVATPGKEEVETTETAGAVTLSAELKEKLMGEKIPDGFEREGIIIGTDYYGVVKSVSTVLGKTVESSDIQKTAVPDGQLFDESYGIRLLVEKGNISVVEILKRK